SQIVRMKPPEQDTHGQQPKGLIELITHRYVVDTEPARAPTARQQVSAQRSRDGRQCQQHACGRKHPSPVEACHRAGTPEMAVGLLYRLVDQSNPARTQPAPPVERAMVMQYRGLRVRPLRYPFR